VVERKKFSDYNLNSGCKRRLKKKGSGRKALEERLWKKGLG